MSWDAWLVEGTGRSDNGRIVGEWNYTHNLNRTIHVALAELPDTWAAPHAWFGELDGKSGPDGAAFLHQIIGALEADIDRFAELDPDNGWGDVRSLVRVLTDMRNAVPEWPTTWSTCG